MVRLYVRSLDDSKNRWYITVLEGTRDAIWDPGKSGLYKRSLVGWIPVRDGSFQLDVEHAGGVLVSGVELWRN
jgi:hypothetical protein